MTILIDTYEAVKDLRSAGFNEAQAETVTRIIRRAQDIDFNTLATKADLAEAKSMLATKADLDEVKNQMATKADLAEVKNQMATKADKADLAETKAEILKWMFGAMGFQTILVLGAVIALTHLILHP